MLQINKLRKNHVVVCQRGEKYILYVFDSSFKRLLYTTQEVAALAFGCACYSAHDNEGNLYKMCLNNPTNMFLCSKEWLNEHIVMQFICNGWLGR